MKYLGLGVLAGLVIMAFIYAAIYAISNKVHTEDDLNVCGLDALGTIYTEKNTNKLIDVLRGNDHISYTDKVNMLTNEILSVLAKNNDSSLYITSDVDNEVTSKLIQDITSNLKGITVTSGKPLSDSDAFNALLDSKNLLLIEQSEVSSFDALTKYKNLITRNSIHVVGGVVVR